MRDLTIEEIELVSGGDAWQEMGQAMGNAWNSFTSWLSQNAPNGVPTPNPAQVQAIQQLCASGVQSFNMTSGGGSFSVNGATKTGTFTVTGGQLQVECK